RDGVVGEGGRDRRSDGRVRTAVHGRALDVVRRRAGGGGPAHEHEAVARGGGDVRRHGGGGSGRRLDFVRVRAFALSVRGADDVEVLRAVDGRVVGVRGGDDGRRDDRVRAAGDGGALDRVGGGDRAR